ncbi:dTMP kinase [Leptolyngbya sp. AN02str]|uniref:dTMP kinase n=1 Tax=Leptolyngbya sp. AN02str TaxID=3423363 RepID=UPI003D310229
MSQHSKAIKFPSSGQVLGKFIVFEGVEGSGKTTQLHHLYNWLRESEVWQHLRQQGHVANLVVTREPGGTELCQEIRQLLLHPTSSETMQSRAELLLYAADRAQHVEAMLKPALAQGDVVLCDRYTDSTVAYQGYGRQLDLGLIHQLNHIATHGLDSDLTLWLDMDAEAGLARAQKRSTADRMEQNSLDFHRRVQQGFAALAQEFPQRIVRIDANRSEAEVANDIQATVQRCFDTWYALPATDER